LGHARDPWLDHGHGTSEFTYWAKAGYGDGPASAGFDDRAWRPLDLPHDFCVELPFSDEGRKSHGNKAIGLRFPQNSVGWYRKAFRVEAKEEGARFALRFDGAFRDSRVWLNGFYLGTEHSGYAGFEYDITDYLSYGGENVIAVRVDASLTEGWFYEGAGIYRGVSLIRHGPIHLEEGGLFVRTTLEGGGARIALDAAARNRAESPIPVTIAARASSPDGAIAWEADREARIEPDGRVELCLEGFIDSPELWSLDAPKLYRLKLELRMEGALVDLLELPFGIREARIDPERGFILNGERVQIKGANVHQDHAGVGVAVPPGLWEYRVRRLKDMGCNAIRCAHHPADPALLDACDRLGVLVLPEQRLMGSNAEHLGLLERMIRRDRNHPSIFAWSLGNEEWAIEGKATGINIARTMMRLARRLDPSRQLTVAQSGGWDEGIGRVTDVMGYNYIFHGDIDAHHAAFPRQGGLGTEETTTHQTRGCLFDDPARDHIACLDRHAQFGGTEFGWKFYAARPWLAGLFYWTGFDYRGEANPNGPAVICQAGLMDLCGFPKEGFLYLRAKWSAAPFIAIAAHWNPVPGHSESRRVAVHTNCPEAELFLNGSSLGRKALPAEGHLEWQVTYEPGSLIVKGYLPDGSVITDEARTTGEPARVRLSAETFGSGEEVVAVVNAAVLDAEGRLHPTAEHAISFSLSGPGEMLGMGNGDPSSREAERRFERYLSVPVSGLKELPVDGLENRPEVADCWDDSAWIPAFSSESKDWRDWERYEDPLLVLRGSFDLPELAPGTRACLYAKSVLEGQSLYVNGRLVARDIPRDAAGQAYELPEGLVRPGLNSYAATGTRLRKRHMFDEPNRDPGVIGLRAPAEPWTRRAFAGLAQVIVRVRPGEGPCALRAEAEGLEGGEIVIGV
jgi:beta-galactosidase